MNYTYQLSPIDVDYSVKDIGTALGRQQDDSPSAENSGVRKIAQIIKDELGINESFFIEYSLIHSVLSQQAKNRLTTFLYGEGERSFLENIKKYYSSIISASADNGITVYQHPDVFIDPPNGKIACSISYITGDVSSNINVIGKPLDSLIIDKTCICGYTEFYREYAEMLSVADKCRSEGIRLEELQKSLHQLLHKTLLKGTRKSTYITIPIEGAEYDISARELGFRRSKCHGVIFVYVANAVLTDNEALLRAHKRVANFVRYSSCNYLFNIGMSLLNSVRYYSLSAAIGSIMSRNGSHNIGSHVLAALSHNVGTMPDDRVLYQYIQQRMDYMASATTDFQDWSVPTAFVGELMKQFYSQHHLLEHIAGSEGLHAYRYQGKPLSLSANNECDYHCIRLNVRSIEGSEKKGYKGCMVGGLPCWLYNFFEAGQKSENWDNDVAVAMPGGVLGQHAFYNIVENIIRNAAKHSWARIAQGKPKNLDIYIDFADGDFGWRNETTTNESKDDLRGQIRQMVSVTIGDGLSLIFDNKDFWRQFFSEAEKYILTGTTNSDIELWNKYANAVNKEAQKCKAEVINDMGQLENGRMLNALKRAFARPISSWASDGKCNAVRKFIEPGSMMSPDDLPAQYRVLYAYLLNKVKPVLNESQLYTGRWGIEAEGNRVIPLAFSGGDPKDVLHFRNRLILPLHHRQEIELSKPFIDRVSNKLKQSGWGLAEMKISAGYLRREKSSVIGGLSHECKYDLPLVVPMGLPPLRVKGEVNSSGEHIGQMKKEDPFDLLELRLAYRIWIERPKKVLVLVDDYDNDWSKWKPANDPKSGCAVKLLSEALEKVGLMSDFGVVVVDSCSKFIEEDWNKLPFRSVVAVDDSTGKVKSDYPIIKRTSLYAKREGNKVDDFVDVVYDAWLSFLRNRRGKNEGDLSIKLNIYEDSGKEKGLISDIDIYRMLFRECLHSVIEPLVEDLNLEEVQREALLLISVFPFEISKEVLDKATAIVSEGKMLSLELFRLWVKQVESFLYGKNAWSESFKIFIKCGALPPEMSEEKRAEHIVLDGLQNSQNTLLDRDMVDLLKSDLCLWLEDCAPDSEFALLKMINQIACANIADPLIARIVNAIEAARVTSDVFLRKYEERIVTLPKQYQISKVDGSSSKIPFGNLHLRIVKGMEKADISYNRHAIDDAYLYSEPLSGSQSYLNALANIKQGDNELAMRLAETGLLRIVIIDERVCSFITKHDFMRPIYDSMRIAVVDTEKSSPVIDGKIASSKLKYVAGMPPGNPNDFELLIIHQGVIDKWWPNHTKEDVKLILSGLRERHDGREFARFVVVTTGRGRPDNIPDDEKVLPFSLIESLLFRRYPEKVTLVNTVMNILPYEKERNA